MNYLKQFTPAESLLVLEGPRAPFREQLKYTLIDLFFKNVLQTMTIKKKAAYKDPEVEYNYVVRGQNFYSYQPKAHELVFLSPYFRMSEAKILFRHLVKMGFENASSPARLFRWMKAERMNPFFRQHFFQRLFGGFSYTQEGIKVRDALREEVKTLEKTVQETSHLPALIGQVYGNICLANVNMEMIKTIENSLNEEMSRTRDTTTYSYWSSCGSWSSFDHGHGGGSGCGSSCGTNHSSGCGNSGCSNSGCSSSGCSGCGGCGGGGD